MKNLPSVLHEFTTPQYEEEKGQTPVVWLYLINLNKPRPLNRGEG